MTRWRLAPLAAALALGSAPAQAQPERAEQEAERESEPEAAEQEQPQPLPWHGTTLSFDQSLTTQTIGIGGSPQSYDPTYEWWFALKPKYWLYESKVETLSLYAWANLYLELTNSDATTYRHEPQLGPTWIGATYARTLRDQDGYKTQVSVGPRLTLPTDKASYDSGQLFALGASAGASQTVPFSRAKDGARGDFGLSLVYDHAFTRATSPVRSDLYRVRQDALGRTFSSDVLRGGMSPEHALAGSATGGVRIVPRVGVSVSYVLTWVFLYAPPEAAICTPTTGCIAPGHPDDPSRTRVMTWLVASADFDPLDELSISLGYYNQANQIGPDGRRRSPLYSPDARFFLTLIANLDALYRRVSR